MLYFVKASDEAIHVKSLRTVFIITSYYVDPSCLFCTGPPTISTQQNNDITKDEFETVKLKCSVDGDPRLNITWWKNGVRVRQTENIEVKHTSLTITDLVEDDTGKYSCHASNDYGAVTINFTLIVIPEQVGE